LSWLKLLINNYCCN